MVYNCCAYMESGGEGRAARPAFQKIDGGLPGGDTKANTPAPVPQSPEQQDYRELLGGFFAKLTRWQTILANDQFLEEQEEGLDGEFRAFDVIATPGGSLIVPPHDPTQLMERPNFILGMASIEASKPELNISHNIFSIGPGQAGRQHLVDMNGEPFKNIEIDIFSAGHIYLLRIFSQIATVGYDPDLGDYDRLEVEYEDNRNRGEFTRTSGYTTNKLPLMPNPYASHLFTTIDTLIPTTLGGSPQSAEKPPPQLPAPGKSQRV